MQAQPWFRKFDGWWYVQLRRDGTRQQVKLAQGLESKDEAFRRWHVLMLQSPSGGGRPMVGGGQPVVALLDVYLDHVQKNLATGTYNICLHHLESFGRFIGRSLMIEQLKPFYVTNWLNSRNTWSSSTKNSAAQCIRTAFRWLTEQGYIPLSPVASVRGPAKRSRETVLNQAEFDKLLSTASDGPFRELLEFVWHTGVRPQEVRAIEARHVDLRLRRIVFPPSESKGKRAPRVIYLDDRALRIIERLCQRWPRGVLFRNRMGRAWGKDSMNCRFSRLRKKLGVKLCLYVLRHSYATNALQRLDPITVSTLLGHLDPSTLARTYQHLAQRPAFLLEAAKKAIDVSA